MYTGQWMGNKLKHFPLETKRHKSKIQNQK